MDYQTFSQTNFQLLTDFETIKHLLRTCFKRKHILPQLILFLILCKENTNYQTILLDDKKDYLTTIKRMQKEKVKVGPPTSHTCHACLLHSINNKKCLHKLHILRGLHWCHS